MADSQQEQEKQQPRPQQQQQQQSQLEEGGQHQPQQRQQHEQEEQEKTSAALEQLQLDLIRPPLIKPSRSLSTIIGDPFNHNQEHNYNPHHHHHQHHHLQQQQQQQQQQQKDPKDGKHHHHHHHHHHQQQQQQQPCDFFSPASVDKQTLATTDNNNKLPRLTNKFGHQLHSQYSMPCSLNVRRATTNTYHLGHSLLDERIIFCQLSLVNKKDFAEEVRALLDVRKFVSDSFILTDVSEVRIEAIVETIIDKLVECRQLGHSVAEEAKHLLFLERDSLSMVLANTMQGLYKSRSDGRLAYDHSWIVATCSLAGLSKRQVAITRFSQPVNFGRQSQEVRFLIIVLAPSKEKLTKSAWETGRTFATMFTDIEFRRRLLRAKNQEEMKVELLVRAENLARENEQRGFKNGRMGGGGGHPESCCSSASSDDNEDFLAPNKQPVVIYTGKNKEIEESFRKFDEELVRNQFFQTKKKRNNLGSGGGGGGNSSTSSSSSGSTTAASAKAMTTAGGDKSTSRTGRNGRHHHHHHRSPAEHSGAADPDAAAGTVTCCGNLGYGLIDDLKRRSGFYLSDFTDGLLGERSLYKTISTTIFLYFSVLLPCIAFGVVDTNNTDGHIDPKKTMIGQALGGLFFALFSGQPLVVVMTTAPLCIYVKVIYQISQDLEVDFGSFYACVGLWMAFFLVVMAFTNSSNLMKHCTRSTEDIFAIFTAFAFGSDGVREAIRSFQKYYWEADCGVHQIQQHVLVSRATIATSPTDPSGAAGLGGGPNLTTKHHAYATSPLTSLVVGSSSSSSSPLATSHEILGAHATILNNAHQEGHLTGTGIGIGSGVGVGSGAGGSLGSSTGGGGGGGDSSAAEAAFALASQSIRCQRETCILFLFLMCGTLWLANSFNSFDRTPYLSTRKREIIKDYALAISVLIFSFIGSYLFAEVRLDVFEFSEFTGLHIAQLGQLSYLSLATACLLGFMASVLFYIDQNICGAMVNNAPYKLKKGNYFHLDLLVLAILNTFLSLTGLPWMHGKLPHSHLHSKALADYEERVDEGHIHQMIVNIRETRMTGILVSILVALSLLAVPYPLSYIPLPVLSGVFLYTALAEFKSNSMVERICLLFTEQVAYPPNHYIRRCPQRKIHLFTLAQIVQLAIVSFIGFYPNPYVNMAFPLAVATFVPVRELLLPKLIDIKYLHSLDSPSLE